MTARLHKRPQWARSTAMRARSSKLNPAGLSLEQQQVIRQSLISCWPKPDAGLCAQILKEPGLRRTTVTDRMSFAHPRTLALEYRKVSGNGLRTENKWGLGEKTFAYLKGVYAPPHPEEASTADADKTDLKARQSLVHLARGHHRELDTCTPATLKQLPGRNAQPPWLAVIMRIHIGLRGSAAIESSCLNPVLLAPEAPGADNAKTSRAPWFKDE